MAAELLDASCPGITYNIHPLVMFILNKLPVKFIKDLVAHSEGLLNFCVL